MSNLKRLDTEQNRIRYHPWGFLGWVRASFLRPFFGK